VWWSESSPMQMECVVVQIVVTRGGWSRCSNQTHLHVCLESHLTLPPHPLLGCLAARQSRQPCTHGGLIKLEH
jgi:hypothetical protein